MKNEFNKDEPIIVTALHGHPVPLERADIASVRKADPATEQGKSVIKFRDDSRSELFIEEDIEEVIRRLNGEPTAERVQEWEREILQARRNQYAADMDTLQRRYEESNALHENVYGIRKGTIEVLRDAYKKEHTLIGIKVRGSWTLQLADSLRKWANDPNNKGFLANRVQDFAKILTGPEYSIFVKRDAAEREQKTAEERLAQAKKDHERDQQRREMEYRRELMNLEGFAKDPQMSDRDRSVLRKKIDDYRAHHGEEKFFFVRDPMTNNYRTKHDLMNEEMDNFLSKLNERQMGSGENPAPPGLRAQFLKDTDRKPAPTGIRAEIMRNFGIETSVPEGDRKRYEEIVERNREREASPHRSRGPTRGMSR